MTERVRSLAFMPDIVSGPVAASQTLVVPLDLPRQGAELNLQHVTEL